MRWLPNILTLLNLLAGSLAIIWSFNDQYQLVVIAFAVSLLADLLDGWVARKFHWHHPWGGQLDSLADMVSFGLLPALLMHHVADLHMESELLTYLPLCVGVGAALRLARFNVQDASDNTYFEGLPSPSAAIFCFGMYYLAFSGSCQACSDILINSVSIVFGSIAMALLMISSLPHFSLKGNLSRWGSAKAQWSYALLALPVIYFLREAAISSLIVLYILVSLTYYTLAKNKR